MRLFATVIPENDSTVHLIAARSPFLARARVERGNDRACVRGV